MLKRNHGLHTRAECNTVQVDSGDSCGALAIECGISAADFIKYNPGTDFCATLKPKQHVCCSSGDPARHLWMISNCGTDVVKGDGSGAIKITYFEGYGMGRECLFHDASPIDASAYTHIHFGFGTLTTDYEVEVGDELSTYQFGEFKRISGTKRIFSFGGWDFSTSPATYLLFRNGVTSANRLKMATNVAKLKFASSCSTQIKR